MLRALFWNPPLLGGFFPAGMLLGGYGGARRTGPGNGARTLRTLFDSLLAIDEAFSDEAG